MKDDTLIGKSEPENLFVMAITHMGMWLATVNVEDYDRWFTGNTALRLHDVRGFNLTPEHGGAISVNIGQPYLGDTKQLEIDVHPIAVEILGDIEVIESADGTKSTECTGNKMLYNKSCETVMKWRAALSNITIAQPSDLTNMVPFPGNK